MSTDKPRKPDFVVCILAPEGEPLWFADNVIAACSLCKRRIQHRPDIPAGIPLACFECKPPQHGDIILGATPEAHAILRALLASHTKH